MRPYFLKLMNPLKLSIYITSFTFLFFLFGLLSTLHVSRQESTSFVRSLSQTMIKTQLASLQAGEYREFMEGVGQEFPSLHVVISDEKQELFRFGESSLLSGCSTTTIRGDAAKTPLSIKICKPLATKLSALIPLVISFLLVVLGVTLLALHVEDDSKRALQEFIREAGISTKHDLSFGDTLNQLKFLQAEFLSLKEKMAFAAEQRTRAKVAAYLAHDLRSPLLVFQEVLRLQSAQELASYKPRLFESISRIQFMINGLKDSDIKTISPREITDFNLRGIVHEAKLLAREYKIRLLTQIEQGRCYLLDKEKVERAVGNLLQNAIELAGSFVVLRMHSKGQRLYITVADDGPGIPPEFDELVFKEHFTFGKSQGTGLGLSYAKEVIAAHGGSISHFRRRTVTVFEIILPQAVLLVASTDEETPKPPIPFPTLVKKNVLVILKNETLRTSLKDNLPGKDWIFKQSIDKSTNLDMFSIVYSDVPELIAIAIQKGLRPVVALHTDCHVKAASKVFRVLNAQT